MSSAPRYLFTSILEATTCMKRVPKSASVTRKTSSAALNTPCCVPLFISERPANKKLVASVSFSALKFKKDDMKRISHLIKHHMFYYTTGWTDGAVRRFIRNVGIENINDLFILREADRVGNGMKQGIPEIFLKFKDKIEEILVKDAAFKVKDLKINGNIIMNELELKPGPIIGEMLNYLLELVLDNPDINIRDTLIEKAKEYYKKKKEYALNNYGKPPEDLGAF